MNSNYNQVYVNCQKVRYEIKIILKWPSSVFTDKLLFLILLYDYHF